MVFAQKWPCVQLFFFKQNRPGKRLLWYSRRKNAFRGYKNKKFEKTKIEIFPKGLTHGFGPNMAIFQFFFLANIGQENGFYDILERKNAFLGYNNNKVKKVEKLTFLQRG